MASQKRNPGAGDAGAREICKLTPAVFPTIANENQARRLPSKATLARRWPRLRINRLSGRWIDDATGAKGDDFASLKAFIRGRAKL